MKEKIITWPDGSTATLTYNGQGSGTITIQSEPNNHYETRSAQIIVRTTDGSNIERTITIQQAAKVRIDISTAIVTAANQTYSGSAKTPTPMVTLNGETIPSSGYDVAYSNNTNAGTATITIAGKGDYTGTATGSFTIAKANPTYTAPTARTGLTYSGSSQRLVTAGSTSHGTIQYSSNGTTWSTTRPSSTNAGSYTTYWRLVGDSNHNDVTSTSLSTTIAKASRTLSFADAYVVIAPSGNITKTATPSAGSGDGAITYSISSTTYATINSSSGKVTAKTSDGSAVVTATIAEGTNYLSATASYNLYVFATTHNFAYTGSVQNVTLPPGSYKLQCWGAQGGNNAVSSPITRVSTGGNGGYSEGVLTITSPTTLYAFVGGQGSSSGLGGWNGGGGGSTGITELDDSTSHGKSSIGSGGGATDFALVTSSMNYSNYMTNRSAASLLSRVIVAGGGSGGCCIYRGIYSTLSETIAKAQITGSGWCIGASPSDTTYYNHWFKGSATNYVAAVIDVSSYKGGTCSIQKGTGNILYAFVKTYPTTNLQSVSYASGYSSVISKSSNVNVNIPSNASYLYVYIQDNSTNPNYYTPNSITLSKTETAEDGGISDGFVGGGVSGGYNSNYDYAGKQDRAGKNGGFGFGGNLRGTNIKFHSALGGGGWYGGGTDWSNYYLTACYQHGGGSGFVNIAANASYRPSGYTGLQLDSGETKDGNQTFKSPSGTNETGHAGNGYARITRL